MKSTPRSKQFDDVYFSAEDGLAETRHVFLEGNTLPAAWVGREAFTVFETGFGTGLNFLSAWKLFEETAEAGQSLHFISIEKFPLEAAEIREALERWEFDGKLDVFLEHYCLPSPRTCSGIHLDKVKIDSGMRRNDVFLTIYDGDVNEVMPGLNCHVDCWFLDGFKPSTNPEMWTDTVFENMARLSGQGASFATFTAAGFVRRGLEEAGFAMRKVPGFGRKREMLVGEKL